MKKSKASILVLLSGILITSGIAFAAPQSIQAFLQPDFRISINNEFKYHPEGLQPIVYQDRTYLPAAYIAEQLGASVRFDSASKVVSIDSGKDDQDHLIQIREYETKITELEERISELEGRSSSAAFSRLPARKTQNGYSLTLEGLSVRDGNDGKLYFTLENKSVDTSIKIQPFSTKIEIDGKEYMAGETFTDSVDVKLFNWLRREDEIESYIPFRNLPDDEDINEMTVTMVVETNEFLPRRETIVFKVLND